MMYVGSFFVDIAEISKISSVNCALYLFRNEISSFEILTQSPTLNFSLLYLVRGLLYRDLLTRKFIVDTNCGKL